MLLSFFIASIIIGIVLLGFCLCFYTEDGLSKTSITFLLLGILLIVCGIQIGSSKQFYLKYQVEKRLEYCQNGVEFINSMLPDERKKSYSLEENGYAIGPYTEGFVLKHDDFYLYITDSKVEDTEGYETFKNDNVMVMVIDDDVPSLVDDSNNKMEAE